MVPLLHQPSLLQHQDAVAGGGRRELVADHQHAAVALLAHLRQDPGRGGIVHAGQRIVENQQGGLHQQGAAQGGALALAAAEGDAPLPHQRAVAIGKAPHIGIEPGLARGRLHPLLGGFRLAIAQVVGQGGGEQVALLGHQGDLAAQVRQGQVGHVHAVEEELARIHLHHAAQGAGQGGLAAAHRAHHRHQLPGLDPETELVEGGPAAARVPDRETAGLHHPAGGHGRRARVRGRHHQGHAVQ